MATANNWYVVTGGPSSGKTTTVNILKTRGYKTTIEHARHYIDTELVTGQTVEQIRANQIAFQQAVLDMQIAEEKNHDPKDLVFFDRAIPDTFAYYRFLHIEPDQKLLSALEHVSYKKIFILDLLPLAPDYARIENSVDQKSIHDLLVEVYTSLSFPIVHVPVLPPEERVDFILKHI
ncbi:hypothetical protein C4568_03880 [Candidatus Parcubacteria bacterium]|nr:MAG: hypothetical protein C4568_03880 [Candidatus Parcubacteria bacterium]